MPSLVSNVRANGTPVLVDLSSPRLDSALESGPDLVKLNDWELAEYIAGPVDTLDQRRAAVARLTDAGAASVVVTRGPEPAYAVSPDRRGLRAHPPGSTRGSREGCGDTMMGAVAAAWASGRQLAGRPRLRHGRRGGQLLAARPGQRVASRGGRAARPGAGATAGKPLIVPRVSVAAAPTPACTGGPTSTRGR